MNLLLAALYMGLIFILSVISTPEGAAPFRGFDKVVHFIIYGIMGLLWVRVFVKGKHLQSSKTMVLRVLAITFFYGLFIEFVQGMLPARDASLFDAIANGLGGVVGVSLYCVFHRYCSVRQGEADDT